MKKFYDLPIVRRFLGDETAQMVSAGVLWVLLAVWFCLVAAMFVTPDSKWWLAIIPLSIMLARYWILGHFGYLVWLEKQKANLRNRIQETLPAGVRFILRDSVEQVNLENQYPGFGEALHKACVRDFFDKNDVIWVDLEFGYQNYRHFRVDKDAICWFKE